jgi:hypothetical protein
MNQISSIEQFKLLVRTFFDDFVSPVAEDGEEEDRSSLLPYVLGALVGPGAFFCFYELPRYADIRLKLPLIAQQGATIEAKFFLITFTVVAVGFFMAWRWDSLFVQEREYLVLASLPIRPGLIFSAKFVALIGAVGAIVLGVNIVPLLVYPAIATVGGVSAPGSYLVHFVVTLAAAAFTFFFFLGMQVLLLNVFSYRIARRLSPAVQLMASAVLAFMLLMAVDSSAVVAQVQRTDTAVLRLLPPFWFVGLYQQLLGHGDHFWMAMAMRAQRAIGWSMAITAVMVPITYGRHMKQVLEATPGGTSKRAPAAAIARAVSGWMTRTPEQRAGCEFVLLTVLRSHKHRLVLASFMALALAFTVQGGVVVVAGLGNLDNPEVGVLSAPLILSFFTMLGLLWAMTMPTGGRARWVFEIAAEGRRAAVVSGARRAFLVSSAGVPILATVPLYVWRFGARAIPYLGMTILLICFASAAAARLVTTIPFIRTERRFAPPQLSLVLFTVWFAFTMYSYAMARLELSIVWSPIGTAVFCTLLVTGLILALWRPVAYEDPTPDWWQREEGLLLVEVKP